MLQVPKALGQATTLVHTIELRLSLRRAIVINTGAIRTDECIRFIERNYGLPRSQAIRITEIAQMHGLKNQPCDTGYFTVRLSRQHAGYLILTDREYSKSASEVAQAMPSRYSSARATTMMQSRRTTMARGQRAAAATKPAARTRRAAVPEPEEAEAEKDYTAYADKEPTATMADFADWLIAEVFEDDLGELDEDSFREGVRLGGTLRMEFQASDFNKERRAERQAARTEPAEAPAKPARRGRAKPEPEPAEDLEEEEPEEDLEEPEEEPEPPARRTRAAAKPAAAKPASRRGAPAPPGKPAARAADRPARRTRARASEEAPY
jgi:hypothetical protein